jgi:cobalt-zinc-cadmium efflux system outer membrane protein
MPQPFATFASKLRIWVSAAAVLMCGGCAGPPCACERPHVSATIAERTGHALGPFTCPGDVVLPNGADPADGLSEDEAVLIALWNNALFQEQLTELDIAYGDLVQAGLLPNPEVIYFFPVTDKPYKYALDLPIEALWLRPIRVAAAERESARVCARLAQLGLDLIRDTRQAYADVLLAEARLAVAQETTSLRQRISDLARIRFEAGDISEQEAATARVDSLQAEQALVQFEYDIRLAQEKLRQLLGLGLDRGPLDLEPYPSPPDVAGDVDELVHEAIATRPDAVAARQNAAAAAERARLADIGWFRLLGILDATSGTGTGHEFGPAFRVTLPIFQTNQGNVARAMAEWDRAERQQITLRDLIILEVQQAHVRYTQARVEAEFLDSKVIPEVEAGIRRAEAAYQEGQTSYLDVLQSTRQLLDSRLRREQLRTDLQRAWVELERSVGRKLDTRAALPALPGEQL